MSEAEGLAGLHAEIRACRKCRDAPDGGMWRRLPHEPNPVCVVSPSARILIAGQAPGARVHQSGVPFTDPSGDRLRDWLGVTPDVFYDPAQFAIAPMGFCFPGYNDKGADLPPRRECAPLWRDRLMDAMPQIELVVAIGMYAQRFHLGRQCRKTLTETVMAWRDYAETGSRPVILPLPHPSWRNNAWLKRNTWFETDLLPVLRNHVRMRLSAA